MRKLSQILAVGAMILAPLAVNTGASALGTCEIGFTGPDSSNKCTSTTKYECTVENNNNIKVKNDNFQFAVTGDTTASGNTTGGGSASGSATNSNGTTYNATVTNGVCEAVVTVPAVDTGGSGGGALTPESPVPTPVVIEPVPEPLSGGRGAVIATLPNTGSESTLAIVAGLIGVFGLAVVLSRLVVVAYGHGKV